MPPAAPTFQDFIGAEFVELNDDGATMRMEIQADHLDADGAVHQAVIFTLADSVLGQGIFKLLRKPCTTAEIKINYLRPATGRFLTAHSRIVRAGARLVVARADVHDGEGQIAEALSTFAIL